MPRFSVQLRPLPAGVTALDLHGFVDRHTVHTLDEALARLVKQGEIRLVVNCTDLGYLSSAGIGVLMAQLMRMHQQGGDMKFYGMNVQVRTLMDVAGFSKVLEICDSEAEALSRFRREQRQREEKAAQSIDAHTLRIGVREMAGPIAVVDLAGDIDRHSIDALERALQGLLDKGRVSLVIDCSGVTFLSSTGMGSFIKFLQGARAKGGDVRFCQMQDNALTVLTMLGLQNIFQVFETEEEAVTSYAG